VVHAIGGDVIVAAADPAFPAAKATSVLPNDSPGFTRHQTANFKQKEVALIGELVLRPGALLLPK